MLKMVLQYVVNAVKILKFKLDKKSFEKMTKKICEICKKKIKGKYNLIYVINKPICEKCSDGIEGGKIEPTVFGTTSCLEEDIDGM